ncbi:MAG: outer membrane beta-barrel protein [Bdellovibrionales bacterium]
MTKILVIASALVSSIAFSQTRSTYSSGGTEVNVNVGFSSGAAAVGGTFEKDTNNVGWGGYAFLQTEEEDAGVFQTLALGGMMKAHLIKNSNIDTYIAPGFGLAMISDINVGTQQNPDEEDKTVFGPSMKLGAQYFFNPDVKIGVEHFIITNWFDDEAPGSLDFTTLVVGFEF